MARHASTYRQARRAAWKLSDLSWPEANDEIKSKVYSLWASTTFGPVRSEYAGGIDAANRRSKYMPHIGKKQRAKGAAK